MKVWKSIAGFVSSAPLKLAQRNEPPLQRIDVERISRELDLENEAKKLAASGLPGAEQTVLTAPEARAVQRIEKQRLHIIEWASYRLHVLNEGLARKDVAVLVNDAQLAAREFDTQARNRVAQHETLIRELATNATTRQHELEE